MKRERPAPARAARASEEPAKRAARLAVVVFVAALAVQAVLVGQYRSDPFYATPVSDALSYHEWAVRIAREGLSSEPVFHQAPLFPLLLGGLYRLDLPLELADRALLLQAVLWAVALALLVPLGKVCFGSSRAGAAAAGAALLHAPFAFHALKLLPLPLAFATQAATVMLTAQAVRGGAAWSGLAAGAACGLACLARSEVLLYAPLAAAAIAVTGERPRRVRLRAAGLFLAGLALVLAPVTAHNLARGDAVLVAASGGENLFIGNRRGAEGGHAALDEQAGDLFSQRALAREVAERELGRALRPSEISSYWAGRALGEIAAAPGSWLALEARKLGRILHPGDPTDMYSLALERRRYLPALWALPLSTWGLMLLAGIGARLAGRTGLRDALPLLALLACQAVALLAFFVSTRLRLPLLFLLAPFAGVALLRILRPPRRVVPFLITGVLLIVTSAHGLFFVQPTPREAIRLASVLSRQGRLDEALAVTEPWVTAEPADPAAVDHAGWVRSKMGRLEEARALYLRALALGLVPGSREAETRSRLASVLERLGEPEAAAAEHDRAVAAAPDRAGPHYERGMFRLRRGATAAAIADLENAARLAPGWPDPVAALRSLGLEGGRGRAREVSPR